MFDCVHITRLSRHSSFYDAEGRKHIKNNIYRADSAPLQEGCLCYTCERFSKSYIRHLAIENEMLGARLLTIHNLHFLLNLMREIRAAIEKNAFKQFKENFFRNFSAST